MNIAIQAQTFLNGLLTEKLDPKLVEKLVTSYLPSAATLLLVLMLSSNAAQLTWRMIPVAQTTSPPAPTQITRSSLPSGSGEDERDRLQQASELHLFGIAGATTSLAQIETNAPVTRLNLTLHGVYVDEDPELGTAIIGTSGDTQKYYKVGATIMSGVKLQGVFNDRVVLSRNGKSEVLRFPKVSNRGTGSVAALPTSAVGTRSSGLVAAGSLREYRELFQEEPLRILEHVRFVPVRSREGLKGYRVLPQKDRKLYNKLGIRPSDLVTSVNGVALTNDQDAMRLIGMLRDSTSVQVEIVRNGQPKSLTFNLN